MSVNYPTTKKHIPEIKFRKIGGRHKQSHPHTCSKRPFIIQRTCMVNYPPTAEPMGWASGVADSPNGNASSRFCLESDCIPQPDNMFKPCFNIFFAAFISLSWTSPQDAQVHFLIRYIPRLSVSQIVRRLKKESTHQLWLLHHTKLRQYYWYQRLLWSNGFFVCSGR